MAIVLSGTGGYFNRAGRILAAAADVNALRGGAATSRVLSGANLATRVNSIEADFAGGTGIQQVVDGIYSGLTAVQGGVGSIFTDYATRIVNCLKAMVSIDQGVSATAPLSILTALDATTALRTLIQQMNTAAATVKASVPALGAQTAVGTPNGNPVIVGSLKDGRGKVLELTLPEVLNVVCSGDSQGTATLGNEPFSVRGAPAVADVWSQLWPGGSGVSATLNAVDGSKSNSAGNVLQSSDFLTATTANVPDNWTLQVGAAGTDVFVDPANSYTTAGGALKFLGTGAALLDAVTQSFNTAPSTSAGAGGTSYALKPNTVYHVSGWVKCSSTPAAGVLELALIDGSAYPGAVIQDDAGNNNLFTKSLTAVGATYVNFNGVFRTPAVLPAATPYKLRLRLSTAIDSGKAAFVGRLSMAVATQLYASGPFLSIHSGNTKVIAGLNPDSWILAVTVPTVGLFQQYHDRVFGMRSLGLLLPSATGGGETIAETLIA